MAEVSPILDDDSFVQITPVTKDGDGNPVSYGVPTYIRLGDLKAYIAPEEPETPEE